MDPPSYICAQRLLQCVIEGMFIICVFLMTIFHAGHPGATYIYILVQSCRQKGIIYSIRGPFSAEM
jgi:hypothetical protein